jgi:hypothetical protein
MFHSCSLSTSSCIATSGSTAQVSVQANAMNQAFGTTAAGEAVPYLSYALIIRNFEDNPEQAMLTDAGTYVGEAVNDEFFRSVA